MNYKVLIKVFLISLFALLSSFVVYHLPIRENVDMKKIDLDRYKNVMFVAHPDDEMFWGGAHLIEEDYLVVCITCGSNSKRLNEFKEVMVLTDDSFIALGYPDKIFGKKNDWKFFYEAIKDEVEIILNSNDWDKIVTHNPLGEYGHIQHIKVKEIVTDLYKENNYSSKLYFFGKYYSKKKLSKVESSLVPISDELYNKKKEIIELYASQKKVKEGMEHMFRYEMWEEYIGD